MSQTNANFSIKSLYSAHPHGMPISSSDLKALGASDAHKCVERGWLERLGRGVFKFPNDDLERDDCIVFLSKRITGLHVGGKTALSWRGFGHNLPTNETISIWGNDKARIPEWFTERFPARYTTKSLFYKRFDNDTALSSLPETPDGPLVSEPERALLEFLSDIGVNETLTESRNILENVRNVRSSVLTKLLQNTSRIKVLRLAVIWSEKLDLPWAPIAREACGDRLGTGTWTAKLKDGTTLNLRP